MSGRDAALAQAAFDGKDWDGAERHARAAVSAGHAPTRQLLALILYRRRNYEAAIDILESLEAIGAGDYALLIRLHLLVGNTSRAWGITRACCRAEAFGPSLYALPRWSGEPIAGRRIVVWGGGYGDEMLFARFVPPLVAAGAVVTINCRPAMVRLLRTIPGVADVLPLDVAADGAELHVQTAELPDLLGLPDDGIWPGPYLHAALARPTLDAALARPTGDVAPARTASGDLRVGLVWAAESAHFEADMRTATLAHMAPLARVPGVRLYSLQVGAQAVQASPAPAGMRVEDVSAGFPDFAAQAATIAELDLVVTVDTALANLAGALGAPVWVAVPFVPDFRWGREGRRSPWYPTATVYRQPKAGDWTSVFAEMADDLADLARSRCRPA